MLSALRGYAAMNGNAAEGNVLALISITSTKKDPCERTAKNLFSGAALLPD